MARVRRDENAVLLAELTGERFNDARDLVRHALKRKDHWQARYGLTSVAESYARGDCDIHLHLRLKKLHSGGIKKIDTTLAGLIRWYISNPTDLCIRAQRHLALEVDFSSESREAQGCWRRSQNCDEAVFVGIVQLVKKNKGATLTLVPSLVWLEPLDVCPEVARDALQTPPPLVLAGDESGVLSVSDSLVDAFGETDRETGVEGGITWPQESKLPSQTIERRAQVVRYLPDQHRPTDWEFLRPTLDSKTVIIGLRVVLGYFDFIEVLPEEPLNVLLETYDLAVCPLDLTSWPIQTMHEVFSDHERRQPAGRAEAENPEGRAIPPMDAP